MFIKDQQLQEHYAHIYAQLLEMLLSKPSAEAEPSATLKMKDLAIDGGEGSPTDALRPFACNIHRDLTDKAQKSYGSCKVHVHSNPGGNATFGSFEKKSKYFNREHDRGSALAQAQDQKLYSRFHESLKSSDKDKDKNLLKAINKWKDAQ